MHSMSMHQVKKRLNENMFRFERLSLVSLVVVVTHGYETWSIDAKALSSLKGWNAKCLCRITGRDGADEYRHPTIDLPKKLRSSEAATLGGPRAAPG